MPDDILGALRSRLHPNWTTDDEDTVITRSFSTRNFNDALMLTNVCAALAEQENHHPDIKMGWGYCHISFTTHTTGALTELDYRVALKLDNLVAILQEAPDTQTR